jgi:LPXTG-site transpeptidase (sortase) family protein
MTVTQTALERELLLEPSAGGTGEPTTDSQAAAEAKKLQEEFDAHGNLTGARPAKRISLVARAVLLVVAVLSIGLVIQLALVSRLQYHSSQVTLYNQFRTELALGTGPLGPTGKDHRPLAPGTPIARLSIPSIGVSAVVLEGTTGRVLAQGPGHYRSTVFPGGAGDSVILGRQAAYGGPFGRIADLHKGATITVVTQVGKSVFKVVDIRPEGSRARSVPADSARLTLGTASGTPFIPSGVVWVDANLVGTPVASDKPLVHTVPDSERPLGLDTSTLWALALWIVALAVLIAGAVWTWRRRGHAQAWIVFTAPLAVVWMFVADQIARILPNLL